jgi:hypothetical protein
LGVFATKLNRGGLAIAGKQRSPRSNPMKRYLLVGAFVTAFVTPALAEQFYVAFDPASHKCTMMHSQPAAPMKSMGGPFKTEAEAHKAMASMKECEG